MGTGVNPGFMMDTLPIIASAVCKSVRGVTVYRIPGRVVAARADLQKKVRRRAGSCGV